MERLSTAVLLGLVCACGGGAQAPRDAPTRGGARPAPGEEPLETESIGDEEVTGLAPERLPTPPASQRPCAWSSQWDDPRAPKPLIGGVGDVPSPVKLADSPIRLPAIEPLPRGDIVVEFVVVPDGSVGSARVVRSSAPAWPEAERAIVDSVRLWRYEPLELAGTPIAICVTAIVSPTP